MYDGEEGLEGEFSGELGWGAGIEGDRVAASECKGHVVTYEVLVGRPGASKGAYAVRRGMVEGPRDTWIREDEAGGQPLEKQLL